MFIETLLSLTDYVLFAVCVFILVGCIYLSFKLRFVQIRFLPNLFKMLFQSIFNRNAEKGRFTIAPHRALFTAMSTTLGTSTIIGPVIAINIAGPGALLGFLLTSFFGSAATYAEVTLSIKHRKKLASGQIMGGPMQYLAHILSPRVAKFYAVGCLMLMCAWCGAQSNQLAAIFDSPLLGDYRIPTMVTGAITVALVLITLIGGIKRVSTISAKLVPIMFFLYLGACFWIIFSNLDKLWGIFGDILSASISPYSMATGAVVGGVVSTLRWGIFKGVQASEAGIGTQAIPHAMAETDDPVAQGSLAMLSTYTAGFVAFLSGCVALITQTWQDPELPLGVSMVATSFHMYFSSFGIVIVALSTLLFAFGTILGNCYNGSQCFGYLTENRWTQLYYVGAGLLIFLGSIADVKTFWSLIDIVLAVMVIPHMSALVLYAYRSAKEEEQEVRVPQA